MREMKEDARDVSDDLDVTLDRECTELSSPSVPRSIVLSSSP